MNVSTLLRTLAGSNIKLSVIDGKLKVDAAKGALTPSIKEHLTRHKAEIIDLLQSAANEKPDSGLSGISPDPVNIARPFPMSDLQLGFYMADDPYMEYHVRPHYYLEIDYIDFDVKRYEQAWNKALKRHKNELNIVNRDLELELVQAPPEINCQVIDFRSLTTEMAARELANYREKSMRRELPLDIWPWFELSASLWIDKGVEKARVHYNHNNFFIDGFAMNKLLNEVEAYYDNPGLRLPELTLSYRDAVLALHNLEKSKLGAAAREYWFKRLALLPPPPAIPQVVGLKTRCRAKLNRRSNTVSATTWSAFKANAASFGLTPSNAVLSAYAVVLSIWSNSKHFILSQMVTRRFSEMHPEIKEILGNFASLYPLEIDFRERLPFYALAGKVQDQVLSDIRHLHIGGMQVMQELNRQKGEFGSAPSPFVIGSALFAENYKKSDFTCLETSQTLLDHQFWELADGRYYYVWDLLEEFFPAKLIDDMWAAFDHLLNLLSGDIDRWEDTRFDLLTGEHLQARERCNRTNGPVPASLLHDFLRDKGTGKAIASSNALVSSEGALSYHELEQWSRAVCAMLIENNIGKGDLVAVVADKSCELMAGVFGILFAGAAYVPVDSTLPSQRIHYLLQNSQATLVLTQPHYQETISWPENITVACILACRESPGNGSAVAARQPDIASRDLAYVIYTSGSTGLPKGVMINHQGAVNTILDINRRFGVDHCDRIFGVSSFSFDLSVYDIFGSVAAGACLYFPAKNAEMNPAHWLDTMLEHDITIWNSVPTLMSLLIDTAVRQKKTLPGLRLVLLSGDKIPVNLPADIKKIAPGANIVSLGGATEASIWSIIYPIEKVDTSWTSIPYGYPMLNQRWYILDQDGMPAPTWVVGELYIAGVGLAMGYWRDETSTGQRFLYHPAVRERVYRTGDLGRYLPDGSIEFLGRVDFQVKIQGQRIELGEIEAALLQLSGLKEAVVSVQSGEADTNQLVAYIVPCAGTETNIHDMEMQLRQKLPNYMVPSMWMVLDRLPVTANGKVDRKALPECIPRLGEVSSSRHSYVVPSNELEKRMTDIWCNVLKLPKVGIRDDFFELGGQSFDAVRIFSFIREEFGKTFSLADIWMLRTIEQLTLRLTSPEEPAEFHYLKPINITESQEKPLFLVHPAGGHVMGYGVLARRVSRSVYGFQARGLTGADQPHSDISEMAGCYLAELKQVQAQGPYLLGGWSSGAMIAFEMAVQLEAVGEDIQCLLSLDGPTPFDHGDIDDRQLLRWFLEDLNLNLPLETLDGLDFSHLPLREQLTAVTDSFSATHAMPIAADQLLSIYKIFRNIVVAGCRYKPPCINADIVVVRVSQNIVSEFSRHPYIDAGDWGWGNHTKGKVECILVPGNHYSFLNADLVDNVADTIGAFRTGSVKDNDPIAIDGRQPKIL